MSADRPRRLRLPIMALAARYHAAITATLALMALTVETGIALLGVSGWFLTGAALSTAAMAFNLFGPSAMIRLLSFVRILSRYGEKLVGHDVTLRLVADVRDWTFRRLIPVVPLPATVWRHGDLVSRLMADVDALQGLLLSVAGPALAALVAGAAMWAALAWALPPAAPAFALGFGIAAVLVPVAVACAGIGAGRRLVAQRAALRSTAFDGLRGFADILACDARAAFDARAGAIIGSLAATGRRQGLIAATGTAGTVLAAGGTMLAVLWIGCGAVREGSIGGPLLVGLVLAIVGCFEGPSALVRAAAALGAALSAKDRIEDVTASRPGVATDSGESLPPGSEVVLDGVSFAYRSDRPLLRGASLACPAGSRTAIVGESGGGKTTVFRLLLGLEAPARGRVAVAGMAVADADPDDLWRRIALMDQDTPVFLGSVRENLLLGRPDATDDDLWQALARAGLATHVADLPAGLGTWCGEGGHTLSAGQARRLCLARVLLATAPILLLDEPTSGLDEEAEQAFLADLPQATAGRTVLVATHASLPPGAVDRVATLADGRFILADSGGGRERPTAREC